MTAKKKKALTVAGIVTLSLALVFVAFFHFVPKPMLHGEYPYYSDIQSITEASDVIIVGEIVSARDIQYLMVDMTPDKTDKETTPYTISTVKIVDVIKGPVAEGDIITIKQIGDFKKMPDAFLHETDGYLKEDMSALMFLKGFESSPYSPLSPQQGIVEVKNGQLFSNSKYSLFGYSSSDQTEAETLSSAIADITTYVE